MINFFKNLILDLLYGKRLGISAQKIEEYKVVKDALKVLADNPYMPAVVVTEDNYDKIIRKLPWYFQHTQMGFADTRNLVIPAVVYQFFLSGGTWKEIEEYDSVLRYGMFHGKKRRL